MGPVCDHQTKHALDSAAGMASLLSSTAATTPLCFNPASTPLVLTCSPPPATPADDKRPTLDVTVKEPLGTTATKSSATIVFPVITAEDSTGEPAKITCSWEGNTDVPYATGFKADFPVGEAKVTCLATDGSGNPSDPASFIVIVCKPGLTFVNGGCGGEWGCWQGRGCMGPGQSVWSGCNTEGGGWCGALDMISWVCVCVYMM